MFGRLGTGEIKACWIICTNPVATVANRSTVIAGLERAELVITQDAYRDTATNRYADIVLPAALWAESDAVMVNSERNLTLLAQSIPPAGQARPDWELDLRGRRTHGLRRRLRLQVQRADLRGDPLDSRTCATGYDLRGASYDRLRETPLQWPRGTGRRRTRPQPDPLSQRRREPGPSTSTRTGHTPRLAFPTPSRRAVFHPRPHMDARELPDDDFPVVLNTGRVQHQWHTMTKTGRVATLNKLNSGPFVEIHPDDATAFGITDGSQVELTSRRGVALMPAVVTDRVRPGNCFVPVSLERRARGRPDHQRADQRCRRPGFTAARVQGVCGAIACPSHLPRPIASPARTCGIRAPTAAADGPLVLWASQTGNAEDFAARVARPSRRCPAARDGRRDARRRHRLGATS